MTPEKFYIPKKACHLGHLLRYAATRRCVECRKAMKKRLVRQRYQALVRARWEAVQPFGSIVILVRYQQYLEHCQWKATVKDRIRASKGKWRKTEAGKAAIARKRRQQRLRDPQKVRAREKAWEAKRRCRELQNGGHHTGEDIERLFFRQKRRCYWCSCSIKSGYHVDHIWPLSKGGSNGPENICLACPTCNLTKHSSTPIEFAGRLL
jgi:5-methylcytosine-specific restriction endonuclease McrA